MAAVAFAQYFAEDMGAIFFSTSSKRLISEH
jgi:hypothetical protein